MNANLSVHAAYITLGKLHNSSVPQFPCLHNEVLNRSYQKHFWARDKGCFDLQYNNNNSKYNKTIINNNKLNIKLIIAIIAVIIIFVPI